MVKLADITEATYAGKSETLYCVVELADGYYDVYGPFISGKEARAYKELILKDYEDPDYANIEVTVMNTPQ